MTVDYIVQVFYDAKYYPELDGTLEAIFGGSPDASGMGFGERDAMWSFNSLKQARECFNKVVEIAQLSNIRLIVDRED